MFVYIGSIYLFGEILRLKCCAGGIMLILGTLLLSYKKDLGIARGPNCRNGRFPQVLTSITALSLSIRPFMSYWILTAIYYLCLKFLLTSLDEWNLYLWSSLGTLMVIIPLMGKRTIREEVIGFFGQGRFALGALISEEVLQFLGLIFSLFAYAIGSVTMVSSVGALQPVLTVILIMVLGALAPKLAEALNERIDRESLMQKGLSFMVMLVGIYFVS